MSILDFGFVKDIHKSRVYYQQLLKYHWEYYSEIAFQRAQIYDVLKASLAARAVPFEFSRWQRAVKYKYSLSPLSSKGSRMDPGGRFNIGEIDPMRFAVFPAIYFASEKDTALDELFARGHKGQLLSYEELALTRAGSTAIVSVSGKLESVLDLRDVKCLTEFVHEIKNFQISSALIQEARRLKVQAPRLVRTKQELLNVLMTPDWRFMPMQCEVPAQSQIFGQVVADAEIDRRNSLPICSYQKGLFSSLSSEF